MFHGFFGASRPLVRLSSRSVFAVLTARAWPQVGGGDEYDVIDAVKSGRITKPGAAPRGRSRGGGAARRLCPRCHSRRSCGAMGDVCTLIL